jgi:hypothetical protein
VLIGCSQKQWITLLITGLAVGEHVVQYCRVANCLLTGQKDVSNFRLLNKVRSCRSVLGKLPFRPFLAIFGKTGQKSPKLVGRSYPHAPPHRQVDISSCPDPRLVAHEILQRNTKRGIVIIRLPIAKNGWQVCEDVPHGASRHANR